MDPHGKVAVVTGASQGIGRATALALAEAGASLLLNARDEARLQAAAQECRDAGAPKVVTVPGDVAKDATLDAIILEAVRVFDGFDILVNNAGFGFVKNIEEITDAEWDAMLAVNLRAPFLLTQAAVKVMRRRGGGQIVQMGSGLSYRGRAGWTAYCATKFGIRGLTEAVRKEVAKENIKVGMVAPGYTHTHFFDDWPDAADRTFDDALTPADIAHTVMAMVRQGPTSDIKEITVRNRGSP